MWNSFFVLSFRLSKSSVLFCTAPATFLNQKFRGQTVVRLLLITCPWGGAEKIKGHQLTVELVCVWECHKLACSLEWFSSSISHNQNRVTIVKKKIFFLLWVICFGTGKTQLNLARVLSQGWHKTETLSCPRTRTICALML